MIPSSLQVSKGKVALQETQVESNGIYITFKRLIDILVCMAAILIASPLFIIVATIIKWEDPKAKVIFKQLRIGKNGKEFYMYKFRSMVSNAEDLLDHLLEQNEVSGAMFKMKDDPRVTKFGKFIRKTSIDELPQLLNVLRGDMSLVGPRPPLTREVKQYTSYELQRLLVIPGCTGLWQVSGRSNLNFDEMVELDLHYIKHRSLRMDFKILFKTFFVLLGSKDAF